jgi:hypothetical protein
MLTQEQRQVIINVIKGNRTYDEIDWDLGFDSSDNDELILYLIEDVAVSTNAADVETVLSLSFSVFDSNLNFRTQAIPSLIKLLGNLNHYVHEDIVRLLQKAKDARAVEALYKAALIIPNYQKRYDEGAALARKCTWALADIGNNDAHQKLQLLAAHTNPEIAGYAQKRLTSWKEEQDRKAFHFLT